MANLAIRGHATRGKEVIEILEMLGGKVYIKEIYKGEYPDRYYFINKNDGFIHTYFSETVDILNAFQTFTLEEFIEKFPYKVGDKAFAFDNKCTIIDAVWDNGIDEVIYTIKLDTSKYTTTKLSNQLQPYKEETMGDIIKIDIPKGYEFAGVDDDNQQVVFEKIGYHYPKTYEECCEIMGIEYPVVGGKPDGLSASTYRVTEIRPFIYLLICRDAYWKIAGWNPKVKSDVFFMHTLPSYLRDLFPMPTEEMRGAFYENFKDLIEKCKKLLWMQ